MEKSKIKFLEDSLLINNKILVLSDLHLGYEEYLYKESLFKRMQFKEILEKLNRIFDFLEKEKIKIEKIIILGDLKHEFGEISDAEWRETMNLLDYLLTKIKSQGNSLHPKMKSHSYLHPKMKSLLSEKIILIKGNHDNILGPIARKREIQLKPSYKLGKICFLHGDRLHESCIKSSETLILGHLHPSISLSNEYKKEKYKCFLKGKWKNKEVYVLPSFTDINLGYDLSLMNEKNKKDFFVIPNNILKNFKVIIYNNQENKEYVFDKVKKLIKR